MGVNSTFRPPAAVRQPRLVVLRQMQGRQDLLPRVAHTPLLLLGCMDGYGIPGGPSPKPGGPIPGGDLIQEFGALCGGGDPPKPGGGGIPGGDEGDLSGNVLDPSKRFKRASLIVRVSIDTLFFSLKLAIMFLRAIFGLKSLIYNGLREIGDVL